VRKIACIAALLALALTAPARAQTTVPTRASLDACRTGAAPLDRYAVFSAQMAAVPGTKRMQVRFDLLARASGDRDFHPVVAPGLGVWRSSAPGVDIFRYRKQVANLAAPGVYRALVRFRWLDDSGRTLQSALRRTRSCKEPDLRADLTVDHISAEPATQPGRARYTVIVANAGHSPAPAFDVALWVGDQAQPGQTVQTLAAGDRRSLVFVGPRCSASAPLRVTVDPDAAVDEADRANNTLTVPCPLSG
jgi:hypothetical protein